ncbi:MAG: hypothetical protein KatS3mg024_0331 [Armatimonadota bacterium]|jgi:EpsI family protein|nr:MAG: hypothetical protein KatS3mg024_0331 [Armatimonadota bacterium]
MSRVQTHAIIVTIVLVAFAVLSRLGAPGTGSDSSVDMDSWVPMNLGEWRGEQFDPPAEWKDQLPAARFLLRIYSNAGTVVELLMIESADPGSFHSPMFCLPGAGWTPKEAGTVKLANGEVTKAEFIQDFSQLVVRYWYLAGGKLTPGLWWHKWNMLANKLGGVSGPNFSFRVTVRQPGGRKPEEAANEFADEVLRALRQKLESGEAELIRR